MLILLSSLLVTGAWHRAPAPQHYEVQIGAERFVLEIAANQRTRSTGLSGRESIDRNGGMIFVFPLEKMQSFYMRDCIIPIDVAFLDSSGVVTATYTMQPEALRKAGESKTAYERRLARYSSLSPAQYAIELRAGTLDRLGIEKGDRIGVDNEYLSRLAN
jgi:uncharacterized membrane protein (UPF0127 family)